MPPYKPSDKSGIRIRLDVPDPRNQIILDFFAEHPGIKYADFFRDAAVKEINRRSGGDLFETLLRKQDEILLYLQQGVITAKKDAEKGERVKVNLGGIAAAVDDKKGHSK